MHEIEERLDIDADKVAEIVEMYEELKKKYGVHKIVGAGRKPGCSGNRRDGKE